MSTFEEQEAALSEKSREEMVKELEDSHEYVFDMENLPKINHHWKQYGIRFVCQGAGHPRHEFFHK